MKTTRGAMGLLFAAVLLFSAVPPAHATAISAQVEGLFVVGDQVFDGGEVVIRSVGSGLVAVLINGPGAAAPGRGPLPVGAGREHGADLAPGRGPQAGAGDPPLPAAAGRAGAARGALGASPSRGAGAAPYGRSRIGPAVFRSSSARCAAAASGSGHA